MGVISGLNGFSYPDLSQVSFVEVKDCEKEYFNPSPGTLKAYGRETIAQKDVKRAIGLAYYLGLNSLGVDWLCRAKSYLNESPLANLIDLQGFVSKVEEISSLTVFKPGNEEVREALAKSPSLKELKFSPFEDYDSDTTKNIGAFLAQSSSVEKVALTSVSCAYSYRLNTTTIEPIAKALETNTSIQELDVADTEIGDVGVMKLIQAIRKNPETKIKGLNLFCCGMTDSSASELVKLLQEKEQILWVNTRWNRGISSTLKGKIKEILKTREAKEADETKKVEPSEPPTKKGKIALSEDAT